MLRLGRKSRKNENMGGHYSGIVKSIGPSKHWGSVLVPKPFLNPKPFPTKTSKFKVKGLERSVIAIKAFGD